MPLAATLSAAPSFICPLPRFVRSMGDDSAMLHQEVLAEQQRLKDNPAPDAFFYDYPRFCYHADAEFHAELTNLYKEELPFGPETRVLDMMSSWVSHYPTDRRCAPDNKRNLPRGRGF